MLFALNGSASGASIQVRPEEVFVEIPPGGRGETTLTIANRGDVPVSLRLSLVDSYIQPDGKKETLPPGMLDRSCADWLTLDSRMVELDPGESRGIEFDIEVPLSVAGSYWTDIRLDRLDDSADRSNPALSTVGSVGVVVDVAGTVERAVTLSRLSITEDEAGYGPVWRVRAKNVGNGLLRCSCRFEMTRRGEAETDTIRLGPPREFRLPTFGERELSATVQEARPRGHYMVRALLECEGVEPIEVVRSIAKGGILQVAEEEMSGREGRGVPAPDRTVGTFFRVQIFATGDSVKAELIRDRAAKRFADRVSVDFEEPLHKVIVGDALSLEEAKLLRKKARGAGFEDAWIKRLPSVPSRSGRVPRPMLFRYRILLRSASDSTEARGFADAVRTVFPDTLYVDRGGRRFHVFLGRALSLEEAERLLARAKDFGFEEARLANAPTEGN